MLGDFWASGPGARRPRRSPPGRERTPREGRLWRCPPPSVRALKSASELPESSTARPSTAWSVKYGMAPVAFLAVARGAVARCGGGAVSMSVRCRPRPTVHATVQHKKVRPCAGQRGHSSFSLPSVAVPPLWSSFCAGRVSVEARRRSAAPLPLSLSLSPSLPALPALRPLGLAFCRLSRHARADAVAASTATENEL